MHALGAAPDGARGRSKIRTASILLKQAGS